MQKRKLTSDDRFERKARAQDRREYREKLSKQSYKYNIRYDEESDNEAIPGVMPFTSKLKGK